MIEIYTVNFDNDKTHDVEFHGRDRREYSLTREYSRYLPDKLKIKMYTGLKHTGSIEFRGNDCTNLINGILDNADDYTLKQIILGAQDRLKVRE